MRGRSAGTTGITLKLALEAEQRTRGARHRVRSTAHATVKPLDTDALLARAKNTPIIIAIEEYTVIGGLGSAWQRRFAEADFTR
jgi:transketolase